MKETDAYLKIVEWSEEDQCYIGSAPPLIGACCHGNKEEVVYRELCQIVDEWVAVYKKDGLTLPEPLIAPQKKFSGRFVLRIDPSLHKALAIQSLRAGKSLNAYLAEKLARVS